MVQRGAPWLWKLEIWTQIGKKKGKGLSPHHLKRRAKGGSETNSAFSRNGSQRLEDVKGERKVRSSRAVRKPLDFKKGKIERKIFIVKPGT